MLRNFPEIDQKAITSYGFIHAFPSIQFLKKFGFSAGIQDSALLKELELQLEEIHALIYCIFYFKFNKNNELSDSFKEKYNILQLPAENIEIEKLNKIYFDKIISSLKTKIKNLIEKLKGIQGYCSIKDGERLAFIHSQYLAVLELIANDKVSPKKLRRYIKNLQREFSENNLTPDQVPLLPLMLSLISAPLYTGEEDFLLCFGDFTDKKIKNIKFLIDLLDNINCRLKNLSFHLNIGDLYSNLFLKIIEQLCEMRAVFYSKSKDEDKKLKLEFCNTVLKMQENIIFKSFRKTAFTESQLSILRAQYVIDSLKLNTSKTAMKLGIFEENLMKLKASQDAIIKLMFQLAENEGDLAMFEMINTFAAYYLINEKNPSKAKDFLASMQAYDGFEGILKLCQPIFVEYFKNLKFKNEEFLEGYLDNSNELFSFFQENLNIDCQAYFEELYSTQVRERLALDAMQTLFKPALS